MRDMAADRKKQLTPKQSAFVAEYLVDLNATQAAIRAGYSPKTANEQASRLLANVNIAAAVAEAQAERATRTEINQDYVLNNLVEITERCMQKRPVLGSFGVQITDEDGNRVWAFNSQGANRALELIGKHLGMFTEKHEHTGKDGKPIEVDHQVSPAVEAMLNTLKGLKQ